MNPQIGQISATPLTAQNFAPFGTLVAIAGTQFPVNQGRGTRTNFAVESASADARATRQQNAIYRLDASTLPFTVTVLERHPLSAQLFLPLRAARYLVVVCEAGANGMPDMATARAFIATSGYGIQYRAGTWHAPLIALDQPADFLMQMWESGTALDCEEHALEQQVCVTARAIVLAADAD